MLHKEERCPSDTSSFFGYSPETHLGVLPEKEIEPERYCKYLEGDKVI